MQDEDDLLPFGLVVGFSLLDVVSDLGIYLSSIRRHVVECSLDDDFYHIKDNPAGPVVDPANRSPKG